MKFFIISILVSLLLLQSAYALTPSPGVGCCSSYLRNETVGPHCAEFNLSVEKCELVLQRWQEVYESYYITPNHFINQPTFWIVLLLLAFGIILLIKHLIKKKQK